MKGFGLRGLGHETKSSALADQNPNKDIRV